LDSPRSRSPELVSQPSKRPRFEIRQRKRFFHGNKKPSLLYPPPCLARPPPPPHPRSSFPLQAKAFHRRKILLSLSLPFADFLALFPRTFSSLATARRPLSLHWTPFFFPCSELQSLAGSPALRSALPRPHPRRPTPELKSALCMVLFFMGGSNLDRKRDMFAFCDFRKYDGALSLFFDQDATRFLVKFPSGKLPLGRTLDAKNVLFLSRTFSPLPNRNW